MTNPAAPHFLRAAKAYNAGDDLTAEREFTIALLHDPQPAAGHLFRGLARLRLGKMDSALLDLTGCLDRDPTNADAAWARGRIYADRAEWANAARDFGRVIAARPDDSRAWSARGEAFQHLSDWPRCVAHFRRAAELLPDDAQVLNRLAWVLATCPDDRCRNGPEALALANRANHLSSGADPFVIDTLAAALAEAGDCPAATVLVVRLEQGAPAELAAHLPARRARYATGQPWRDA